LKFLGKISKPIITPKWVSVDMNWGGGFNPQPPTIPTLYKAKNEDARLQLFELDYVGGT